MNTNYYHVVPLSREEKEKAYSELEKGELVKRLIEREQFLDWLYDIKSVKNIEFLDKGLHPSVQPLIVPYQLCPKCNGIGLMDNPYSMSTTITATCDVCNGAKIIPQHHEITSNKM